MRAPADLQRRFAYLPPELQRNKDWEFKLTADRTRVQQALAASRESADSWPEWELLWPQHPIVQWLGDRVVASFRRHEAPVLRVQAGLRPDEAGLLFQGILSNQRSQPVIVEWFAVVFGKRDAKRIVPLTHLIDAGALASTMPNAGVAIATETLSAHREAAVREAVEYMKQQREARADRLRTPLKDQQRRVNAWKRKALEQLDAEQTRWTSGGRKLRADQERRLTAEREEIEARVNARIRWIKDGMATVEQPYLRIAAALVGSDYAREAS